MAISIRQATAQDAESLAALEVTSWRVAYRGLMPDTFLDGLSAAEKAMGLRRNLQKHGLSGRKRVLVARHEDEVLGFVRFGAEEGAQIGTLYLLYVRADVWGCGVGTALMQAAMVGFVELGVREAVLWVLRDNQRARRFYERGGWRPDGQTARADYGGIDLKALCYRRLIDQDTG